MPEPEPCGAAHPTDEALYCTRSLPCFYKHEAWEQTAGAQVLRASWPNPNQPPKTKPTRGGIKRKVVPEIPPSPGTPQQAWEEHYGSRVRAATAQAEAEGIAKAEAAASEEFKAEATATIARIAAQQPTLTTDHVWRDLHARNWDTEHRGCMGALIRKAVGAGILEKTNEMSTTTRDDQRAHGLTVWRSLIYTGPGGATG